MRDPVEEARLVAEESLRLERRAVVRRALRRIKHGHKFGRSYRCPCGMWDVEYDINHYMDLKACPLASADELVAAIQCETT